MDGNAPIQASTKYSFKHPASSRLERNIRRDDAQRLIAQRMYPAGCIWIPGDYLDHPEFGDLFAPDEEWPLPVQLGRVAIEDPRDDLKLTADERNHYGHRLAKLHDDCEPRERAGFYARDHGRLICRWVAEDRARS